MPTTYDELRSRVSAAMDIVSSRLTSAQYNDWITRAIQELVRMVESQPPEKRSWEILAPLYRDKADTVTSGHTIAYPEGCLSLTGSGNVDGVPIARVYSRAQRPRFSSVGNQPSMNEVWLELGGTLTGSPTITVLPKMHASKAIHYTYVGVPAGTETFSELLTELVVYGAAKIGLMEMGESGRMAEVDNFYKNALAKAGL